MKIRNDFVTNSSSSSFIIAMKEDFTEKEKEEIISFVKSNMCGHIILRNKEDLDNYFRENYGDDYSKYTLEELSDKKTIEKLEDEGYYDVGKYINALNALNDGLTLRVGNVCFDGCDVGEDLLTTLWSRLANVSDTFKGIDIDLEY